MNRIDVLNALIKKHNYQTYCEIGVQAGHCFNGISCPTKIGVDPDPSSAATLHMTSDEFFANIKSSDNKLSPDQSPVKFDIFWIDGLHHADQVERDILSALDCLNEGGTVCCHDMLPTNKHMQEIPLTDQVEWTGNCWRAFLKLRCEREDLEMCVVNTDWGCGIIRLGKQEKVLTGASVTYEDFVRRKEQWMNVISVEEFKNRYL